ncbi:hypothetical protein [Streptomyces sp. NPDC000229]|uniref:hypothetical protein n=1 Tax=Streptomyces sp. NPDC000229 TaxID=3154247 RepID=UPI003327368E
MNLAKYTWQPAACPTCKDAEARFFPGDSDRADIVLCSRCPHHGHLPYYDPYELLKMLAPTQVLAMTADGLYVGTPVGPDGLTPPTLAIVDLAASNGLRPTWRTGSVRHTLVLSALEPRGAFGWVMVGARSGKILRAQLTHHDGAIATATGVKAVRDLIASLPPSPCPPPAANSLDSSRA